LNCLENPASVHLAHLSPAPRRARIATSR
jgi:hypothetical protein